MPSLLSHFSLSLLSLLHYRATALALPTTDTNTVTNALTTTAISKREMGITIMCPSSRAPEFGSVSGAWHVLEHLKTLDNGPRLPDVSMEDNCRRMGCAEDTGVFWCVKDVSCFSAVLRFVFSFLSSSSCVPPPFVLHPVYPVFSLRSGCLLFGMTPTIHG